MFENSAKICFETFAGFDPSIRWYFWMVSSLILLRSLGVHILKQLFFSISVSGGFSNIYFAASQLGKYLATINLDFQKIIVNCKWPCENAQLDRKRLPVFDTNFIRPIFITGCENK